MKVTKIVREFVEEEVNKKYPMPELDMRAAEQLDKDIEVIKERIKKEASEFVFKKMKEAGLLIDDKIVGIRVLDWRYLDSNNISYYDCIVNSLRKTNQKLCDEVKAKRERAIKDILVSLELGGTKKTLLDMLANLPD